MNILNKMIPLNIILVIIFSGCRDLPYDFEYLKLKNNSNNSICFSENSGVWGYKISCGSLRTVNSNSSDSLHYSLGLTNYLKGGIQRDTFIVLAFDSKYCKYDNCSNSYDSIEILKIYRYTIEDLQKLNYTITYPPIAVD